MKSLNIANWCNGKVSKKQKFDFQSQFSTSKIIRIFVNLSLKNTNLEAHLIPFDYS